MRKLMACLAISGVCFLASTPSTALPPLCSWICCNDWDSGAECTTGGPWGLTDCQTWWYSGGICP